MPLDEGYNTENVQNVYFTDYYQETGELLLSRATPTSLTPVLFLKLQDQDKSDAIALTQEQMRALLPYLQRFAETGLLFDPDPPLPFKEQKVAQQEQDEDKKTVEDRLNAKLQELTQALATLGNLGQREKQEGEEDPHA